MNVEGSIIQLPINGVEQSDTDYGGVYIAPINHFLWGLPELYEPQVSDAKE